MYSPKHAKVMYSHIEKLVETPVQLQVLFIKENQDGETALNMAGKYKLPELMLLILNTVNVYKFTVRNCGSHRHV